eukprot:11179762-Lingulodinium_polyedra.AAC.1
MACRFLAAARFGRRRASGRSSPGWGAEGARDSVEPGLLPGPILEWLCGLYDAIEERGEWDA